MEIAKGARKRSSPFARIEDAVGHVARHLLRADQHAFDLCIIDLREI